ncbi:phage portal protein [Streptomyces ovatisporus]|uniref:Phage portal protein n=1 Tax=Streptomyces ovatisporus TaxID=1128682 RepID=A0ABV9A5T8_9ACTN
MEQALALVDVLERELMNRRPDIDRNEAYYGGDQPLKYASDQFRKFHADRYKGFADNWVQIVSDSPVERLTANGIQPAGADKADEESWRVWQANGLDADSQLGFLGAVNSGRSFVLVWGNPDDEQTPEVTFEDASQCIVLYEPGSRRKRRAALKRWSDGEVEYATLYLPDEMFKFERAPLGTPDKSVAVREAEQASRWSLRTVEDAWQPNPLGVVPMVELPNRPRLTHDPISDVTGVIAMQDAVNLLWSQLFTATDIAAFPARIILGGERPMIPLLNEAGEVVGERPVDMDRFAIDRVMHLTGENVSIDEWTATNLNAYTDIIEVAVGHIAAQTRTPQHYLIGKMANLSGDALIAAETGLVKRVQEKQVWFGQALREMYRLIALAQGNEAKAKAISGGTVLWADAASRSQAQTADAILKLRQIGFPFEYLALTYGLSPAELVNVLAMRDRELQADPMGALTQMMAHDPRQAQTEADDDKPSSPAAPEAA